MSGAREVQTRAVVVGRAQSGEGSTRVQLYSEALGRVWAVAKSAREERSKLRPHLQVGTYGSFDLVKGAYDWRVVGAVGTVNAHFALGGEPRAQRASARMLSLIRQLIQGDGADPELFSVVWEFLTRAAHFSEDEVVLAERFAVFHILRSLGYISLSSIALPEAFHFTESDFAKLRVHEKDMTTAIHNGFVASGLA